MKVWLFQTGEPIPGDSGVTNPMRCINLATALVDRGHEVVVWTSAFSHQKRSFRDISVNPRLISDRLTVVYTQSSGYQASVGLARLFDHLILGANCYQLLKRGLVPRPDVAVVGFPPIEFAFAAAMYLRRSGIPYVVDPKDMWPEFFSERLPSALRPLGRAVFWPLKAMRDFVFRHAFSITTISDGFLRWALGAADRARRNHDGVFPLTSSIKPPEEGSQAWTKALSATDLTRIGDGPVFLYAGTLTQVLDIHAVKTAAKRMAEAQPSSRVVICGDGSASLDFDALAAECPNVICLGRVSRGVVSTLLAHSVASLIPYRNYESMSAGVPNKLYDAAASGVPIISCLAGDVASMIETESVGLRYTEGDGESLHRCIEQYLADPTLRDRHSRNIGRLYAERFEFNGVYDRFCLVLEAAGGERERV